MADLDLGSLLSSLSPEDMSRLQTLAGSLLGGSSPGPQANPAQGPRPEKGMPDLSGTGLPDLTQFANLAPVLSAFGKHDDRVSFIEALKPLLSEGRRKKADEAIKLLRLLSLLPLLRERGIF